MFVEISLLGEIPIKRGFLCRVYLLAVASKYVEQTNVHMSSLIAVYVKWQIV
jgi:hypothetical protein